MNLQQLKILVLLAEHKKVTAVSELIKLKHPTVNFHMKKLEDYIGAPLFDRRQHRVFLNDTAKLLLPYARQIVSTAQEAEAVLLKSLQNPTDKITIGCSSNLGSFVLPRLLSRLRESFPEIDTEIKIDKPELLVNLLLNYEIDFGLFFDHHLLGHDLSAILIQQDEFGFVLYPSHPLAQADSIHPLQIERERWILREQGIPSRQVFDLWSSEHRLHTPFVSEFGATEAIKGAIRTGLGISILNYLSVFEEVENGQLVFIKMRHDFMPPRNLYFAYNPKFSNVPTIRNVIQFISDSVPLLPIRSGGTEHVLNIK